VALAGTASFFLASGLNFAIKGLVARSRPPQEMGLEALVGVPGSPSFPSGHAMSAFAVAAAIAVLAPRARWPLLGLATAIAFSRVYLGVHFWIDVLAGAALGLAIGVVVGLLGTLHPGSAADDRHRAPSSPPSIPGGSVGVLARRRRRPVFRPRRHEQPL
jgi:undecaprenyl-diphosphatase